MVTLDDWTLVETAPGEFHFFGEVWGAGTARSRFVRTPQLVEFDEGVAVTRGGRRYRLGRPASRLDRVDGSGIAAGEGA